MRDLVKEGRELQDKITENFRTTINEVDIPTDSEIVKDTDNYVVLIPNSLDTLKKIIGNVDLNLSAVGEKTSFQVFCVLFKEKTTQYAVPQYKHFTVISTEDNKLLFFNGNNDLVSPSKLFSLPNNPGLTKTTFTFGANDGRVIIEKPTGSFNIMKAWDELYKTSAKNVNDFKAKYSKKIKTAIQKELGIDDKTIVKETDDLIVFMPQTFKTFKHVYERDVINHVLDLPTDKDTAYQIFVIVHKPNSKYYQNKQFKIITIYVDYDGNFTCYDYRDKKITMDDIIKLTKLSRSTFRYGANDGKIFVNKAKSKYKNNLEMLKALYSSADESGSDGKSSDKGGFKNSLKKIAMSAFKNTEPMRKDFRKLKQNIFK
jgi:hypothetical protein